MSDRTELEHDDWGQRLKATDMPVTIEPAKLTQAIVQRSNRRQRKWVRQLAIIGVTLVAIAVVSLTWNQINRDRDSIRVAVASEPSDSDKLNSAPNGSLADSDVNDEVPSSSDESWIDRREELQAQAATLREELAALYQRRAQLRQLHSKEIASRTLNLSK
ncbi:MAG: hypothetical protein AAFN77_04355 [Planctomycetota bacterium]